MWRQNGRRIERRRTPRLEPLGLAAHYWTGGLCEARFVRNIGLDGALIDAPEVYYPGTIVRLAFENAAAVEAPSTGVTYAGVWGKVIRNVGSGFCVSFLFETRAERLCLRHFLEQLRRKGQDETNGGGA